MNELGLALMAANIVLLTVFIFEIRSRKRRQAKMYEQTMRDLDILGDEIERQIRERDAEDN